MEKINAISKVRFSSARPQIVGLHKGEGLTAELLCMEAGQNYPYKGRERLCYVITGTGKASAGSEEADLAPGLLIPLAPGQACTITNSSQQRLVCLVIYPSS